MLPIIQVAEKMGLAAGDLELHGEHIAKIPLDRFPDPPSQGPLVVVTSITPTPAGEGKTTCAIGLTDALGRLGRRPVLTLRQPSLAPLFGAKGGGTGGGQARLLPEADINLHFTGDAHAVASAHNLLAAIADAAVHHGTVPGLTVSGLEWRRVTNVEDRALRRVATRMDGTRGGPLRETGFDIDAASEIMAVLALAAGYDDLRDRLSRLVTGYTGNGTPVTASDLGIVGAMMALLKDAVKPNLVQTLEGQPALVHTGPFANIAHGASSVLADRLAMACGDIVVTEAGFGADLGLEKFVHIKSRSGGVHPTAAVVVVTVRALKRHGGVAVRDLARRDEEAVRRGVCNMEHAISLVRLFGLPAVVAINRFQDDTDGELAIVKRAALDAGAHAAVESESYSRGGIGSVELAEQVVSACEQPSRVNYLYPLESSVRDKVDVLVRRVYGGEGARWGERALRQAERYESLGWGGLPVCMANTHLSLSADPRLVGCPRDFMIPITELRLAAGAGFVYPLVGRVLTMPGLPRSPRALKVDLDESGQVVGLG